MKNDLSAGRKKCTKGTKPWFFYFLLTLSVPFWKKIKNNREK
ncbi:hypothetical protein D2M30_0579 [Bacillus amyloliquefaciens]|nr:hypothetical protein D2M30_0579 [Bacillus amyloliquefaciens]